MDVVKEAAVCTQIEAEWVLLVHCCVGGLVCLYKEVGALPGPLWTLEEVDGHAHRNFSETPELACDEKGAALPNSPARNFLA